MNSVRTFSLVVGLVAAQVVACGGDRPKPAKLAESDKAKIAAGAEGKLAEFAKEMEKLVAEGDVGAIETRWLMDTDLAGCNLGDQTDSAAEISKFLEKQMQKFRDNAQKDMSVARRGEVLALNHWSNPKAELKNKKLTGSDCKATAFGRVNVIIKPNKAPPAVIEHRFNAIFVNDEWKPYRYLPGKPNCKGKNSKRWLGCNKLADAAKGGSAEAEPAKAEVEKAEPTEAAGETAAEKAADGPRIE
jgi:hypothetical protein